MDVKFFGYPDVLEPFPLAEHHDGRASLGSAWLPLFEFQGPRSGSGSDSGSGSSPIRCRGHRAPRDDRVTGDSNQHRRDKSNGGTERANYKR